MTSADRRAGKRVDVFLQPGEYAVGDASQRLRTMLGSCVSVTLWCPLRRVGAMSHFLLASRGGAGRALAAPVGLDEQLLDGRYGDEALWLMVRELGRRHVDATQCQAKIFGGGNMFPTQNTGKLMAVGRRNGEAARSLLQAHGIEVVSESLFGDGHRQIAFDVDTGHVWARQLPPAEPALSGLTSLKNGTVA